MERACSITSRTSLTPELMALKVKNGAFKVCAIILAMVVLPVPGGPHKIMDGSLPCSMAVRKMLPLPVRCSWPANSSKVVGRNRSASGGKVVFTTKVTSHSHPKTPLSYQMNR